VIVLKKLKKLNLKGEEGVQTNRAALIGILGAGMIKEGSPMGK